MNRWLSTIAPCPSIRPSRFPAKSLSGYSRTEAGWIEPKRVIYDHELILIREGVYHIEIDDRSYDCAENTFVIIPPSYWHSSTCVHTGLRYYAHFDWIHHNFVPDSPVMTFHPASPEAAQIRSAPAQIPKGIFCGKIQSSAIVFDLMERLHLMMCNEEPHERLAGRGVLLELLIRLLDPRPRPKGPKNRQESLAHRVRGVLDTAMAVHSKGIAIRELLGNMGHSYEHLARCFRLQYGLTPINYVQSIRIERAKSLLRQTDYTIETVADTIGYEDAVYFSRLFKRHTGLSPGRFRCN